MSLFVATLEVSIVSTSLETIADDLGAFRDSSWIVIAYLLTYTGMSFPNCHQRLVISNQWYKVF